MLYKMKRNLNKIHFISSQGGLLKYQNHMKEFAINKFLKLRLEDDKTVIYVNDRKFNQCKFLLLEIPLNEITALEDIDSIDDVAYRLDTLLEQTRGDNEKYLIPPEVEFWGHCSNLQVWYENNYNTKLIHKNLAFPLLKRLTEVGEKAAIEVFKEEIAIRFSKGNKVVKEYLKNEGYLGYLDQEQFSSLLHGMKFDSYNELFRIVGTYFIIDRRSTKGFVEFIELSEESCLVNSEEAKNLDFYRVLIEYLGEYKEINSESQIIRDIFRRINKKSYDSLIKLIYDEDGYINLPILEALIYVDRKRIKNFLENTAHQFKYDFDNVLWSFQYLLNVLLRCFNPEELMIFLGENHKDDLYNKVLPRVHGFEFLNMASQNELDIRHFVSAFLLEEAGAEDYRENLERLGELLADIFLSELIDRDNEVNEQIIRTLIWIGGEPAGKLYKKIGQLSERYDFKKYQYMFY